MGKKKKLAKIVARTIRDQRRTESAERVTKLTANEKVVVAVRTISPEMWDVIFSIVEGTLRSNEKESPIIVKLRAFVTAIAVPIWR